MSADEFDPHIERLFAQTPSMPDAPLFAAEVERKLAAGSRIRTLALTLAGVVGGAIAVRETVGLNLHLGPREAEGGFAFNDGVAAASASAQSAVQSGLDQLGLDQVALGSLGGMQLFWISAGALIALLAAGAVKLSQEG